MQISGHIVRCFSSGLVEIASKDWNYDPNEKTSLVKITRVGLCSSDFKRIFQGKAWFYPMTIGHEITGEVVKSSPLSQFKPGDRVVVFPLIPCRSCEQCAIDRFNLCSDYSYFGSRIDGGLQSYLEVPNWNIYKLNKDLASDISVMMEPMSVVIHAFSNLTQTRIFEQDLLILGSGFLSFLAALAAKNLGSTNISVLSVSKRNSELFEKQGITFEKKYRENSIDGVLDFSGDKKTIERASEMMKPRSRMVTIANPHDNSAISKAAIENILRKELQIKGSWNSSFGCDSNDWNLAEKVLGTINDFPYPQTIIHIKDFVQEMQKFRNKIEFQKSRIVVCCEC